MRKTAAAILFMFAGAMLLSGVMVASSVFDDYKDSTDATYLIFGAIFTGVAAAAGLIGARLLRNRS